jgi:GNAT superfamily N-acetyltransferase
LDADLRERYLTEQEKFDPLNKMDETVKVLLAYNGETAIGCGALRPLGDSSAIELKRMYVHPDFRGIGISRQILEALEQWAAEDGYTVVRLETGNKQPEAIGLYLKRGYQIIPSYGEYKHIESSVCMEKRLIAVW